MPDLPQIPGTPGAPQIPGASGYTPGGRGPMVPRSPTLPGAPDGERPPGRRRRQRRGLARWPIGIALIVALIGLARAAPEVKTPAIDVLPKIDVPDVEAPTGESRTAGAAKVPSASVFRAGPGAVAGHPETIVELGVRKGQIRWVAASRFPTTCSDGTKSSGLIFYTDEGTPRGSGRTIRYEDRDLTVTYRRDSFEGSLRYDRVTDTDTSGGGSRSCTGSVDFRTQRVNDPTLAQGLLDADRRAAQAFGGGD